VRLCKSKLTHVLLIAVCIAIKIDIKHSALPISKKLEIIKKVDAQSNVMHAKVTEQLIYLYVSCK
jgi:hypothetical protein